MGGREGACSVWELDSVNNFFKISATVVVEGVVEFSFKVELDMGEIK